MLGLTLYIIGGLIVLLGGAEALVRGSSSLALRAGISPLIVGLTVVAFGTSSPELAISIKAALLGKGDIALGNVVGSNIFNVALILGLTGLVRPVRVKLQVLRFDLPVMLIFSAVAFFFWRDRSFSRGEGVILLAGLAAYIAANIHLARRERNKAIEREYEEGLPRASRAWWIDALLVAGGLVLLVVGARLFVFGAVELATALGVSQAIISLTIVAAGTSLPELATSVVAALRGEDDIAIGNIIGSNVFNLTCILGTAATIQPFASQGVSAMDLYFMLGTSAALLPIIGTGLRLNRWEGGLLLASYGAYIRLLWP